jgi:hypothetical protein
MGVGWSLLLIAGAYMAMLVGFCGCSVTKNTHKWLSCQYRAKYTTR